jgi:hypothetical protein
MSYAFGDQRPKKPHLVQDGKGGVAGEVGDLRSDIEDAFTRSELGGYITPEGGAAVRLINKTGAASVKGTVIQVSSTTDLAFQKAVTSAIDPIGVVYEDGVADGGLCLVVVAGFADVLLEDSTAATRGYWVKTSTTVAGRADATTASPPGADVSHWQEVGHALQSVTAGSDKLCRIAVHFN